MNLPAYFSVAVLCCIPLQASAQLLDVWIGTGRANNSKGIYHATLNSETGRLSETNLAAEMSGPGFLAMHPNKSHLYAVGSIESKPSVAAFRISGRYGEASLSPVNSVEIGDGGAAHVGVHPTGKILLTAQYGGGSVAVFRLKSDGSLDTRTQLIEHEGGSRVVPGRQESPHPHWTGFSPDGTFAFVPDLGLDQVNIYRVDADTAQLSLHGEAELPPGGGPRHMKFHPSGRWVYVLNELSLSVTVFDYDAAQGSMKSKQTLNTVPKEQLVKEQFKSASEIRVHPNGRFVYSANRGHDTITVFRVNAADGTLNVVEREHIRGATPRNFNLEPSAKWLLAAGQQSHTLGSFAVDETTGELTFNRSIVSTPAPICVLFTYE